MRYLGPVMVRDCWHPICNNICHYETSWAWQFGDFYLDIACAITRYCGFVTIKPTSFSKRTRSVTLVLKCPPWTDTRTLQLIFFTCESIFIGFYFDLYLCTNQRKKNRSTFDARKHCCYWSWSFILSLLVSYSLAFSFFMIMVLLVFHPVVPRTFCIVEQSFINSLYNNLFFVIIFVFAMLLYHVNVEYKYVTSIYLSL